MGTKSQGQKTPRWCILELYFTKQKMVIQSNIYAPSLQVKAKKKFSYCSDVIKADGKP